MTNLTYTTVTVPTYDVPAGYHVAVISAGVFVKERAQWAEYEGEPTIWFDNEEEALEFFNHLTGVKTSEKYED